MTPYYNKPTQDGLFRHYTAIADAVDLPIFIYNIPGRSVVDVSVETMARLALHPNIVGCKDATANLLRPLQIKRAAGAEFCQLSGEDGTGATLAVTLCARMQDQWDRGEIRAAMAIQERLLPLHDALFAESSPAPVKYAASLLGRCDAHCRLPLAPVAEATQARVRAALEEVGLLG